ncbi:hypothetical protein ACFVTE_21340 [Arthrobacter sp. NPDC058097]|uniref:DUF7793 family protein n=1 Tax=Arthrobacter sp. NPDC058097 TaxID=3346340 RepID=UPI0036D898B0
MKPHSSSSTAEVSLLEHHGSDVDRPRTLGDAPTIERLDDELVGIILTPGVRITAANIPSIRSQLISVFNERPCGLLLHMAGASAIEREAMTLYMQAITVTALAIVGHSPVDRVIAHRLLGVTSPSCPSRYFTQYHEALEWLRSRE